MDLLYCTCVQRTWSSVQTRVFRLECSDQSVQTMSFLNIDSEFEHKWIIFLNSKNDFNIFKVFMDAWK